MVLQSILSNLQLTDTVKFICLIRLLSTMVSETFWWPSLCVDSYEAVKYIHGCHLEELYRHFTLFLIDRLVRLPKYYAFTHR